MKYIKYILILIFALSFAAAGQTLAKDAKKFTQPLKTIRGPITLDYGASPLLAVVFNHSTHKSVKCVLCHHELDARGGRYEPCTAKGCHDIPGARARSPLSAFMAFHDPDSDRSCYGCHKREARQHPEFVGCRPCHISPMAKAIAGKK